MLENWSIADVVAVGLAGITGLGGLWVSLQLVACHIRTRTANIVPIEPPPPRPLTPPSDDSGALWWEEWTLSVRGALGEAFGADGRPTEISKHLFLGCATAKTRSWRERAAAKEYWPEGGVREWGYQKYRDWENEGPYPLYLHEDTLREHCYILGRTGGGKSSLAIMPLLLQLIRGRATGDGKRSAPVPIVILDLKGDSSLFHTVKAEAEAAGQRFKFFNVERDGATYRFNPFRGFNPELRSLPQLCQMILDALALNHGRVYGRGYYTERSRVALAKALKANPNVASFPDFLRTLQTVLRNEKDKRARVEAFELLSVIETLTHYRQLVTSPEEEITNRDGIIFMPDVLKRREVVYFWLPAALESISVGEIAKLVLFNLRAAAQDHKRLHSNDPVNAVLVIDELQHVVGENLAGILRDARSFGIGAILANQSLKDLRLPSGFDLAPIVLTNTCVKFVFAGESKGEYYAFVQRGEGLTRARPYPEDNDPWMKELAVTEFAYKVRSAWPLSRSLYDERDRSQLPDWSEVPGGAASLPALLDAPAPEGTRQGALPFATEFTRDGEWREQLQFIASLFKHGDESQEVRTKD